MVEGYLWPQLYGIFSMVEGYPWPQTSELRDSGLCSISLSSFFRIPLQTITGSLGLLPKSSLPPILRQGHALGRLRYHTYKRVGAFSFPQKSTIHRAPTLATPTLSCWPPATSSAVHGAKGFVGCAGRQTPEENTQSMKVYVHRAEGVSVSIEAHIAPSGRHTARGQACTYPLRQQLSCPGFPLIALRFLLSRSFVLGSRRCHSGDTGEVFPLSHRVPQQKSARSPGLPFK